MKYALNTNAVKKDMDPGAIVALALDCGLDGIEWGVRSIELASVEMKEMAQRTADAGLEVVGWLLGGKPWKMDDLKRRVDLVAAVGGRMMRVDHPWVAWDFGESLHQEHSFHEIFRLAQDALPPLVELSARTGIRFLFETHAGALLASPLAARQLLEGMDPARVGVIYDPGNTCREGRLAPRSEVEVLGDYLAYVHAKNTGYWFEGALAHQPVPRARWVSRTVAPDAGILDWIEVFFALKNAGFEGWISSEEYFTARNLKVLKAGVAFLRDCERAAPEKPCAPFTTFNA